MLYRLPSSQRSSMSIPPSDIVRRAAGGGINKYVRDSITEIRKSQLNVDILGNLGIIDSNQDPVLDSDDTIFPVFLSSASN